MAIKNGLLGGTDFGTPTARVKPTDLNDTLDEVANRLDTLDTNVGNTTTGHDHDGTDSKAISRWELLDSGNLGDGTSTSITLSTGFASNITEYRLVLDGVATAASSFHYLRINNDTTSTNYKGVYQSSDTASTPTLVGGVSFQVGGGSSSGIFLGVNNNNRFSTEITISNRTEYKLFKFKGAGESGSMTYLYQGAGSFLTTDLVTSLVLINSGSNYTATGKYRLYGFVNYI